MTGMLTPYKGMEITCSGSYYNSWTHSLIGSMVAYAKVDSFGYPFTRLVVSGNFGGYGCAPRGDSGWVPGFTVTIPDAACGEATVKTDLYGLSATVPFAGNCVATWPPT